MHSVQRNAIATKNQFNMVNLVKFKQDINNLIDECCNSITNPLDSPDITESRRVLMQTISYFNRMSAIYRNNESDKDDELESDDSNQISDEDDPDKDKVISDNSGDELFNGRTFVNPSFSQQLQQNEIDIRRKLLGISNDHGNTPAFEDERSVDPIIYSSSDDERDNTQITSTQITSTQTTTNVSSVPKRSVPVEDETDTDYKKHNLKQIYVDIPVMTDIVIDDNDINYDSPQL
jgi:hypothetical protein